MHLLLSVKLRQIMQSDGSFPHSKHISSQHSPVGVHALRPHLAGQTVIKKKKKKHRNQNKGKL